MNTKKNRKKMNAAIMWGDTDTARALIEAGVRVDDKFLIYAAYLGHTEIVRMLIEAGADVCAQEGCALRFAIWRNHVETARVLIEAGSTYEGLRQLVRFFEKC